VNRPVKTARRFVGPAALVLTLWVSGRAAGTDEFLPDYLNPDCARHERVEDLVRRLTLPEKIKLLENESPAIPHLGVAAYDWWSEGIHGVARASQATVFPAAIGLAATWDVDLVERVATVTGTEARAKHQEKRGARYHGLTYWAPAVDLARDPRWGRIEETYGEDPHLVSQMGLRFVRGLQGDDPTYLQIAATPKHFAVHSQETDRHSRSFDVSPRVLHEYYLAPFRECFVTGQAASVMTAYNGINGVPCTANRWLITELLRGQWGFDGAVVTDWGAPRNLCRSHQFVASDEQAVAAALNAGVDVLCQYDGLRQSIIGAVNLGLVTEADLDRALRRSLAVRFRLGMFDPPERVPYEQLTPDWLGRPEHVALAWEASRKAMVLLKNSRVPGRHNPTPVLPLDPAQLDSIAVIGSHANRVFLGAYSGEPAQPPWTTFMGVTNHVGDRVIVRHVPWLEPDSRPRSPTADVIKRNRAAALRAAADADVAVVVLGLDRRIEAEGRDRQDLALPKEQQEFVEKVVAVNPVTVVVLINGSPLAIPWLQERVPAIVEAWYPGEQGGRAIADVLFGDYNPAGRLPITFYKSLAQLPDLNDHEISLGRTYLYLRDPPLYPFGHGLSYTTFEYRNLRVAISNGALHATVDVANTGARDGDEVVQLYVRSLDGAPPQPLQQLRAFTRVAIPRGATRAVELPVAVSALADWNERRSAFMVTPGRYEIRVGASSEDIRLVTEIRLP
jgi:beta-glucosidase